MEKKARLDRIDKKILEILSLDGRISYQKLSEQVNLTARPCLERVRLLERAGIIRGYSAIIELPEPEHAFVIQAQIALADHGQSQAAFEQEVRKTPEVLDCWLVGGSFDFLVRIGCRNMEHYRLLADNWLTSKKFRVDKIITLTELQVIKRT
ncbi:Lrp/AsnC family transcriptional regulator [Yersinia aleksiciae]|uniref:Leucine-responsive regulatory protein n=1 Tax=Yersinia aleksiciae TaxID=263819 RepID=A0A0T9T7Q2_YERAE|nr:Lrp/AsnC family transcriptional regulator [Yersinia aleksiciae]MDA5498317.1 Lrp/AsnC family transcriptional regulator [Yersinia aleksiciae]MDN0122818.1 Lrp/AsnC family transcriptional regulator [Yersinia aleksiciae]NIK99198.1 Lrp/AsnC family transcriptional regulator [Yersinia aleksiciae]WQC72583.1 Lrp/AsnC family transcriptional regulator [Yersinia aleksiciae]CFQ45608.1 leucine-responsive regulatory protein [Yersinia aleksiciae]